MKTIASPSAGFHYVKRSSLFEDMIKIYPACENVALEYPFDMSFVGEQAVDIGGVSRDVMTAFWQEIYERMFDRSTLLVPVVNPSMDLAILPLIGKILSHGYLSTGFLPVQISLPTLIAMLFGPGIELDSHLLTESFLDFLSDVDRDVLRRAINFARTTTSVTFPTDLKDELLTVLSAYELRKIPSPTSLKKNLSDIAKFVFLSNPMSAIVAFYSGVPGSHKPY